MAVTTAISSLLTSITELIQSLINGIYSIFHTIFSAFFGLFFGVFSFVGDLFKGVANTLGGVGSFVASNFLIIALISAAYYGYTRYTRTQGVSGGQKAASVGRKKVN
ncbi:hypothetical protein B0T20DRAFT_472606 [Sordaria brevicollis]|uniref:Uncharacterized protein n=1 Tax=Sordaria brevicollis TaxID=83679 RepID=A0AAE0U5M6_SORBR|nr:hypothetical protein B0T20DRAFT_472606 [Sordaria brevicollis]